MRSFNNSKIQINYKNRVVNQVEAILYIVRGISYSNSSIFTNFLGLHLGK